MLAADLAQRNVRVRVNAVAPGVFVSEMSKPWIAGETMTPEEVNIASGTLLPLPAARAGKFVIILFLTDEFPS
jgi:NAD(P)-dependent dehydrogenase (short-subunit alcohol dehydrogenase family)